MVVSYTAKQTDITDDMKNYLEKRLEKIKFFYDRIISIGVVVARQRGKYTAEIKMSAGHDSYFAEASESNWKKAFDSVTDKITREVKKKKDRITDHHK